MASLWRSSLYLRVTDKSRQLISLSSSVIDIGHSFPATKFQFQLRKNEETVLQKTAQSNTIMFQGLPSAMTRYDVCIVPVNSFASIDWFCSFPLKLEAEFDS